MFLFYCKTSLTFVLQRESYRRSMASERLTEGEVLMYIEVSFCCCCKTRLTFVLQRESNRRSMASERLIEEEVLMYIEVSQCSLLKHAHFDPCTQRFVPTCTSCLLYFSVTADSVLTIFM